MSSTEVVRTPTEDTKLVKEYVVPIHDATAVTEGIRYRPVQLGVDGISVLATAPTRKRILDSVSGIFGPGELIAVMGSSGGGKTTFLDVCSGTIVPPLEVSGQLTINGRMYNRDLARQCIKRVPQDDLLFSVLTPRETLVAAATFAGYANDGEANERASELLEQLELIACEDVVIGTAMAGTKGLSGGQKRRLSVALELTGHPSVILLDEPTSGLDAVSAKTLINLLRTLASRGATVICSIHQPSAGVFLTFQRLLLLAAGKVCYLGPVTDEEPLLFFSKAGYDCPKHHNPADFVIEVLCHESKSASQLQIATLVVAAMTDSTAGAQLPMLEGERPSDLGVEFTKFSALMRRHFYITIREPAVIGSRVIGSAMVGCLIGTFFFQLPLDDDGVQERINLAFFSLVFLLLSTLTPTLGLILPELSIVAKEVQNNHYSVGAYYLAKTIVDTPLLLIGPVIYTAIVCPMSGLVGSMTNAVMLYFAFTCQVIGAHAWTILICCAVPNMQTAMIVGPVATMPLMLFSGFFRNVENMLLPFRIVSFVDFVRYGWEMSMFAIFTDTSFPDSPRYSTGDIIIANRLDIGGCSYSYAAMFLWGMIILFRLLGYMLLWVRLTPKAMPLSEGRTALTDGKLTGATEGK